MFVIAGLLGTWDRGLTTVNANNTTTTSKYGRCVRAIPNKDAAVAWSDKESTISAFVNHDLCSVVKEVDVTVGTAVYDELLAIDAPWLPNNNLVCQVFAHEIFLL